MERLNIPPTKVLPTEKETFNPRKWTPNNQFTVLYFAVIGVIVILWYLTKHIVYPKNKKEVKQDEFI